LEKDLRAKTAVLNYRDHSTQHTYFDDNGTSFNTDGRYSIEEENHNESESGGMEGYYQGEDIHQMEQRWRWNWKN